MDITNNSKAKQGLRVGKGLVWFNPGETKSLDFNGKLPSAFKSEGRQAAKAEPKPEPVVETEQDEFDVSSDEELRDFIEEKTSDRPHHKTGRSKLLEMARAI